MIMQPPAPEQDLSTRRANFLAKVHADRAERRAKWRNKINDLAFRLTEVPGLDCPPPEKSGHIHWNEAERAAVSGASLQLREEVAEFVGWVTLSDAARVEIMRMIIDAIIPRVLPEHRRRDLNAIPDNFPQEFFTGFNLPQPGAETSTEPATTPEPPKAVRWTEQEQEAIMIFSAHHLRKDGIGIIPMPDDSLGNMMFCDSVRLAQDRVLPKHRRLDLTFVRGVLDDYGMAPRFEQIMKLPKLPPVPEKAPEIEELIAMARPPESKRNGTHDEQALNGHRQPAAQGLTPQQLAALAGLEDIKAKVARALEIGSQLEAFETRTRAAEAKAEEAREFTALFSEASDTMSRRLEEQAQQIKELAERVKSLSTEAEKKRRPRVAILGCRKDKFDEIEAAAAEHGLAVDLRHYDSEQDKTHPVHADYAIMMPSLPHKQSDHVINAIPRGQWVFISNFTTSRIIAQLKAWFQTEIVSAL